MTDKNLLRIGTIQIPLTAIVLFVSFVIALQNGFNYGLGNHNTYLLQGFHFFQPDLLARDWLTNETTHYHPYFSWIVYGLYMITPSGWSFGIANFLLTALSVFYIYKIIENIFKKLQPALIFLIVSSFIAATETFSLGGSYIFSQTFQPSTIASLTFLIGFYYFLKDRFLLSGIFLAVGGLFHVNFLILGIPLYGAFFLYQRDKMFIKNLALQLVPSLLVLLLHLPNIIASSISPDASFARYIFQEIHAPQHYLPNTYLKEFLSFYSWHIFAFVLGWKYLDKSKIIKSLKVFFIIQFLFITLASILTTIIFIPSVSQLYVWRLAPFSVLLAQMIGAYGIIRKLEAPYKCKLDVKHIFLFFLYSGLIALIWNNYYGHFKLVTLRSLLFLGLVVVICGFVKKCYEMDSIKRLKFQSIIVILLYLYAGMMPFREFSNRNNLITGLPENEVTLFQWIDKNTSKDALFLIPPRFQNFRLNGKRSVVVDWKSTPVVASELVEWYRRVEDVINHKNIIKQKNVAVYYDQHTNSSLLDVYQKYRCDYAVVRTGVSPERYIDFKILYSNNEYTVLQKH